MWMPVFSAIFKRLAGNLLNVDGSATQLPSILLAILVDVDAPFKSKYQQKGHKRKKLSQKFNIKPKNICFHISVEIQGSAYSQNSAYCCVVPMLGFSKVRIFIKFEGRTLLFTVVTNFKLIVCLIVTNLVADLVAVNLSVSLSQNHHLHLLQDLVILPCHPSNIKNILLYPFILTLLNGTQNKSGHYLQKG